jgi:predicted Zn-dependent peptidase
VADWEWYADYPELVRRVNAEDIRRVAATYFLDDALTAGLYLPKESPEA